MSLLERIMARVVIDPVKGCWIFQGARTNRGYAKIYYKGRLRLVHRALFEDMHGELPDDIDVRHSCDNPPCCNPDHLDPVTVRENTLRGEAKLFKPRAFYVIEGEASHV